MFVAGQFGSSSDVISAVSDDTGGTLANKEWVKDKFQGDAGHGQGVIILRRAGVPAGTRVVTITFSSGQTFTNFAALMVNNIDTTSPNSPLIGSNGANPSGT